MSCTPSPAPQSLLSSLAEAADAFAALPDSAPADTVALAFTDVREALWSLIEASPDPMDYLISWRAIADHGQKETDALSDMEPGSPQYTAALDHIKHLVQSAADWVV